MSEDPQRESHPVQGFRLEDMEPAPGAACEKQDVPPR